MSSHTLTSSLSARMALLLVLPPLMWAANAVAGRLAVGLVPPLGLNAARWTLVALMLAPWAWQVLKRPAQWRARVPRLILLGLFGMATYNSMQYMALHTSTPVNVTLIASASPVSMLLVGAVLFGVRPRRIELAAAALSMLGVLLVISRGHLETLVSLQFAQGDALMIVAVLGWSVYSWLLARPSPALAPGTEPRWTWQEFLFLQTVFGLCWALPTAAAEATLGPQPWTSAWVWGPGTVALLLFVALGPSLVAYWAWGKGVASVGPAVASLFANLTPLFAALMAAVLLGEWPKPYHLAAFALIAAGIGVSAWGRRSG